MYYILHGEDEFSRSEMVAGLKARMGDVTSLSLNTTVLNGKKVTLPELMDTCNALPFLGERRLVVVEGLLSWLEGASSQEENGQEESGWRKGYIAGLLDYLPHLPPTTRLVFLEDKVLAKNSPVLALAREDPDAYIKEFPLPRDSGLPPWIIQRIRAKGGEIEGAAAQELANFVGPNLRLLDSELEKLCTYVDGGRPITRQDVWTLVSYARARNVFALVDALGREERDRALQELSGLLSCGEPPMRILALIAWQVRFLLQVKDLSVRGWSPEDIRAELGLRHFQVRRFLKQGESFTLPQLKLALRQVLEADIAIKSGQMSVELALELLVSTLGREETS